MNLTYLEVDHQRIYYHAMAGATRDAFMNRLVMSWLYHEHALDGVVLTAQDLERALEGMPCRSHCDAQVHHSLRRLRACIDFVHASAARGDELSLDWLRDVHSRLCDAEDSGAGRYRKRDTTPGVYNLDVVPAASISYYMHKFLDAYRNEWSHWHPVRAAAVAHWEFMRIFPFDERSGFVGRLMLNFLLLRDNYPPAIIHARERPTYFAALNHHASDLVPVVVEAVSSTIHAAQTVAGPMSQRPVSSARQMAV